MITLPTLQFELDTAELCYALATVGAKTVWGLDTTPLFPESAEKRQALYEQGFAQLEIDGWLQPAANDTWEIDPNLLWVVAIVANPQIVSITTHYLPADVQQVAIHYLSEPAIVELVFTQTGKYRFTTLPDQASMLTRISSALLPTTEMTDFSPAALEVPTPLLEALGPAIKAKQSEQAQAILQEAGVADAQAVLLLSLLMQAKRCAEIELSRTLPEEILGSEEIILLQTPTGYWQMRAGNEPETMIFETVTAPLLADCLSSLLEALGKIEVTPQPR